MNNEQERHDQKVARALINTAELGGYQLKKLNLSDDMKAKTITIVFEASSSGFVQDPLPLFEREPELVATVDTTNGHIDGIKVHPGDHAETEALASAEIAAAAETDPDEQIGEATEEPRVLAGEAPPDGTVVQLDSKKRR